MVKFDAASLDEFARPRIDPAQDTAAHGSASLSAQE